jgi:ATP-binding cassette, subfamily G (WHITE), member 2, PDR
MLEIVNNTTSGPDEDWHTVWQSSQQRQAVDSHIEEIHATNAQASSVEGGSSGSQSEFAAPFIYQLQAVTIRVFQQYWRMPSYVFAKWALSVCAGLFIGFSFYRADTTLAGMSTMLFSVFMISTIFTTLVGQVCGNLPQP